MYTERDPFSFYDENHDEDFRDDYEDEELFDEFDCLFPGNCCMPELHFISECHTPEMAAEFYGHEEGYEDDPAEPDEVGPDEIEAASVEATRNG